MARHSEAAFNQDEEAMKLGDAKAISFSPSSERTDPTLSSPEMMDSPKMIPEVRSIPANLSVESDTDTFMMSRLTRKIQEQEDALIALGRSNLSLKSRLAQKTNQSDQLISQLKKLESSLKKDEGANVEKAVSGASKRGSLQVEREAYGKKIKELKRTISLLRAETKTKSEQIGFIEFLGLSRREEADDLRQELKQRKRQIISLEVELETHDSLYFSAMTKHIELLTKEAKAIPKEGCDVDHEAKKSKHMGSKRMRRLARKIKSKMGSTEKVPDGESKQKWSEDMLSSSEHQKVIDMLQMERSLLKQKYRRSKISYAELMEKMGALTHEVSSLEKRLRDKTHNKGDSSKFNMLGLSASSSPSNTHNLKEYIATIETERDVQKKLNENLKRDIENLKKTYKSQAEENAEILEALRLENDAKSLRVIHLERSQGKSFGGAHSGSTARFIENHEAGVKKQTAKLKMLHGYNAVKDKKIEALTEEIVELRLKLKSKHIESGRPCDEESLGTASFDDGCSFSLGSLAHSLSLNSHMDVKSIDTGVC